MGVWKGGRHPPTPYPPCFIPLLVPIKLWGKVVFLQNKGMGEWNLGFPTPIFMVMGVWFGSDPITHHTYPRINVGPGVVNGEISAGVCY